MEREDFEAEILLIAQAICPALEDANLVVEPFDEAQRDLVLGLAVGGDSVPMALDHFGKLLVGFQALPDETGFPVLKETPSPSGALVLPQLAERLLEQVGGIGRSFAASQGFEHVDCLPSAVRFSWRLSKTYFWPLI